MKNENTMSYEDPITTLSMVEMESPLMVGSEMKSVKMKVTVDDWQEGFDSDDKAADLDKISFD